MSTTGQPSLATPLRACARGVYPLEASAELLIGHASWLQRSDFRDRFVRLGASIGDGAELAEIDWPAAIAALDAGELPCSGGEERILRLAASLADGIPVNLRNALTGIDNHGIDLVSRAVRHANGNRPPTTLW